MIGSDQEPVVMRERQDKMEQMLQALRASARPEEWPALSAGYGREIERMRGEVRHFLVQGGLQTAAT